MHLRTELLDHARLDVERRLSGLCEGRVLEAFGPDAEHDLVRADRGSSLRHRNAELTEHERVSVDGGLDEVHRRRPDERRDEQAPRLVVQALRRVELEDLPRAHDGDAVAERHRLDLVVRDVHRRDSETLVQLRERSAHADAQLRVEVRERLVHEEGLRLAHDRPAHRDTLALSARECGRPSLEQLAEPEQLGHLVDAPSDLRLLRPADLQAVAEVVADAHVRVERVRLEDHRDVAVPGREVGDVAAADRDRAFGDFLEARDHAQQRRLPAAGRPDEDDELAVVDLERDVVDRDDVGRRIAS